MNFCSRCGARVRLEVPAGDTLPRHVCGVCRTVHYQNPKIVAGCIPEWGPQVLLCRRAIEPRRGLWTLPAGFMENGESTEEAAARETREETLAEVEILSLYTMYSLPHISQVYLMFRGRLRQPEFGAGDESLEVRLFEEHEIPWEAIAFRTVRETLQHYFRDRAQGQFPLRVGRIDP
jgi:ADP-ribose pyrophosphatase YjhB (NUDIX family)